MNRELRERVYQSTLRAFGSLKKKKGSKKKENLTWLQKYERDTTAEHTKLALACLDAPIRKEPKISAEERKRRFEVGRNYNIGMMRWHNEINHDLACKIQYKLHAAKMLPSNSTLKREAMKVDDEAPPIGRFVAKWTPPIPGYDPKDFADEEEEDDLAKALRSAPKQQEEEEEEEEEED